MPLEQWISAIGIGSILGAAIGWFARAWEMSATAKRVTQERVARRSEDAASQVIPLIDSMRSKFDRFWGVNDGPKQDELVRDFEALKRLLVDVSPAEARDRLSQVADALYYYHEVSPYGPQEGWYPHKTARAAAEAAYEIVGAIRRSEALPATPDLDVMTERIATFEAHLAEQLEQGPASS